MLFHLSSLMAQSVRSYPDNCCYFERDYFTGILNMTVNIDPIAFASVKHERNVSLIANIMVRCTSPLGIAVTIDQTFFAC